MTSNKSDIDRNEYFNEAISDELNNRLILEARRQGRLLVIDDPVISEWINELNCRIDALQLELAGRARGEGENCSGVSCSRFG